MSDWPYSTDDPASPYFGASANYGSPQGILDYGSQTSSSPQYQGLFGNEPGLFGMSPQWQDFIYLMGSALRDYGNGGRSDSFGNAIGQWQALNQHPARSRFALASDPRQRQADQEMASANYGSTPATVGWSVGSFTANSPAV